MANLFDIFNRRSPRSATGSENEQERRPSIRTVGTADIPRIAVNNSVSGFENKDGAKVPGNNQLVSDLRHERHENTSSFTIPKLKRNQQDLLTEIPLESHEFQQEILPALTKCYRFPSSSAKFTFQRVQVVHNAERTQMYLQKRKEMRQNGYTEREMADSYAFLFVESDRQVEKICKDGLRVGNVTTCTIGHPAMGVQLCRFVDIIRPGPFPERTSGRLLMFKIIKGRVKAVIENRTGTYLEPTPNHDSHVAKTNSDLVPSSHLQLFESNQIYLYEYGDLNVEPYPRHVLPFAVILYRYKEVSPTVKTSDTLVLMSSPKIAATSAPSLRMIMSSPKEAEDPEYVIWCGRLKVRDALDCQVKMVATACIYKPARLGSILDLHHSCDMAAAAERYFGELTCLRKNGEVYWKGFYINVAELRPRPDSKALFQKLMNHLGKTNTMAVIKPDMDTIMLMVPDCSLTYQLGLTRPHHYPVMLHCIFLSRHSVKFKSPRYVYKNLCQKSSGGRGTAKFDSCPPSPLSVNTNAGLVPGTIGLLSPPLSVAVHSMPDASPTFRSSSLRRDSELTVWAGSIQAQKSCQYLATPIQNPQPVFGVEVTAGDDNDELDVPAAASGAKLLSPTCASRRQLSSSQGIESGEHVAVPTLALNLHKLHRSLSTDLSAREQPLSPNFMLSGYDEGFLTSIPPTACVDYNRLKDAFATQRQIQDGIIGNSSPASSRLEHPKCLGMLSASPLSISRDSHRDLEQDDTITSSTSHDQQGMVPPKTRTFSTTAPASPAPSPEKSVDSDTIDMVSRGPSLLTNTLYTKESFAKAKSIYALPPDIPEYKPTPVAPLYEPSPKRPKLEESPFPSPPLDRIPSRRLSTSSDKLLTLKSPSYHPASISFARSVRDLPLPVSPADSSTDKLRPTGSSSADIDTADDMKNFLNSVLERKPSIRPPLPPKSDKQGRLAYRTRDSDQAINFCAVTSSTTSPPSIVCSRNLVPVSKPSITVHIPLSLLRPSLCVASSRESSSLPSTAKSNFPCQHAHVFMTSQSSENTENVTYVSRQGCCHNQPQHPVLEDESHKLRGEHLALSCFVSYPTPVASRIGYFIATQNAKWIQPCFECSKAKCADSSFNRLKLSSDGYLLCIPGSLRNIFILQSKSSRLTIITAILHASITRSCCFLSEDASQTSTRAHQGRSMCSFSEKLTDWYIMKEFTRNFMIVKVDKLGTAGYSGVPLLPVPNCSNFKCSRRITVDLQFCSTNLLLFHNFLSIYYVVHYLKDDNVKLYSIDCDTSVSSDQISSGLGNNQPENNLMLEMTFKVSANADSTSSSMSHHRLCSQRLLEQHDSKEHMIIPRKLTCVRSDIAHPLVKPCFVLLEDILKVHGAKNLRVTSPLCKLKGCFTSGSSCHSKTRARRNPPLSSLQVQVSSDPSFIMIQSERDISASSPNRLVKEKVSKVNHKLYQDKRMMSCCTSKKCGGSGQDTQASVAFKTPKSAKEETNKSESKVHKAKFIAPIDIFRTSILDIVEQESKRKITRITKHLFSEEKRKADTSKILSKQTVQKNGKLHKGCTIGASCELLPNLKTKAKDKSCLVAEHLQKASVKQALDRLSLGSLSNLTSLKKLPTKNITTAVSKVSTDRLAMPAKRKMDDVISTKNVIQKNQRQKSSTYFLGRSHEVSDKMHKGIAQFSRGHSNNYFNMLEDANITDLNRCDLTANSKSVWHIPSDSFFLEEQSSEPHKNVKKTSMARKAHSEPHKEHNNQSSKPHKVHSKQLSKPHKEHSEHPSKLLRDDVQQSRPQGGSSRVVITPREYAKEYQREGSKHQKNSGNEHTGLGQWAHGQAPTVMNSTILKSVKDKGKKEAKVDVCLNEQQKKHSRSPSCSFQRLTPSLYCGTSSISCVRSCSSESMLPSDIPADGEGTETFLVDALVHKKGSGLSPVLKFKSESTFHYNREAVKRKVHDRLGTSKKSHYQNDSHTLPKSTLGPLDGDPEDNNMAACNQTSSCYTQTEQPMNSTQNRKRGCLFLESSNIPAQKVPRRCNDYTSGQSVEGQPSRNHVPDYKPKPVASFQLNYRGLQDLLDNKTSSTFLNKFAGMRSSLFRQACYKGFRFKMYTFHRSTVNKLSDRWHDMKEETVQMESQETAIGGGAEVINARSQTAEFLDIVLGENPDSATETKKEMGKVGTCSLQNMPATSKSLPGVMSAPINNVIQSQAVSQRKPGYLFHLSSITKKAVLVRETSTSSVSDVAEFQSEGLIDVEPFGCKTSHLSERQSKPECWASLHALQLGPSPPTSLANKIEPSVAPAIYERGQACKIPRVSSRTPAKAFGVPEKLTSQSLGSLSEGACEIPPSALSTCSRPETCFSAFDVEKTNLITDFKGSNQSKGAAARKWKLHRWPTSSLPIIFVPQYIESVVNPDLNSQLKSVYFPHLDPRRDFHHPKFVTARHAESKNKKSGTVRKRSTYVPRTIPLISDCRKNLRDARHLLIKEGTQTPEIDEKKQLQRLKPNTATKDFTCDAWRLFNRKSSEDCTSNVKKDWASHNEFVSARLWPRCGMTDKVIGGPHSADQVTVNESCVPSATAAIRMRAGAADFCNTAKKERQTYDEKVTNKQSCNMSNLAAISVKQARHGSKADDECGEKLKRDLNRELLYDILFLDTMQNVQDFRQSQARASSALSDGSRKGISGKTPILNIKSDNQFHLSQAFTTMTVMQ